MFSLLAKNILFYTIREFEVNVLFRAKAFGVFGGSLQSTLMYI